MKKFLIRGIIVLVVLIVVAVVAVGFFLDSIVKKGVETIGPEVTKVSVKLDGVSLSLLSGSGKIKGLVVGNPEGYKAPQAISVGLASMSVSPASVLSDKIVIRSIHVESPDITIEGGLKENNLTKILDNVNAYTGSSGESKPSGGQEPKEKKPAKKLEVDDFMVTGAKVHLGTGPAISLPDIHLKDLGKGSDGITAADLTKQVISEVLGHTLTAAAGNLTEMGKGAIEGAGKEAGKAAEKVGKSLGDIFKKKN